MRSNAVTVGAVGLIALGLSSALAYQEYKCWPPERGKPDNRPGWCFQHGHSYGAGHGSGFSSGGGTGTAHASFGGFGHAGAGHGGGS